MTQLVATPALEPQVTKKPTKLMTDLAAAIRATTESARDQALAAIDADATQVTETIRAASTDGAEALRLQSEADLASIKEWSKAEIARVREEADAKIAARKTSLESALAAHAAAVEHRVDEVAGAVARYRADMEAYFEGLASEDDPARLATMAEAMPEPPALDALVDLGDTDVSAFTSPETDEPEPLPAEPMAAEIQPETETVVAPEAETAPEAIANAEAAAEAEARRVWGMSDQTSFTGTVEDRAWADDSPGWTAAEDPQGLSGGADSGDPVDRDSVEGTNVAEAADGETAKTADGVAAEAAEAAAAMSARIAAGEIETESFTDRLASLMPGYGDGVADGDPVTTQVVVTGLVSVASIASFKRHLGRLAGVQGVAVSSGPDGEFVFNVNHQPDVSFRDAIPSLPGFAARVTDTTDGVVSVSARDPETEG